METKGFTDASSNIATQDTLMENFKAMMFRNDGLKINTLPDTQNTFDNIFRENLGKNNIRKEAKRVSNSPSNLQARYDFKSRSEKREVNDKNVDLKTNIQKQNVDSERTTTVNEEDKAKQNDKIKQNEETKQIEKPQKAQVKGGESKEIECEEEKLAMMLSNIFGIDIQDALQIIQDVDIDVLEAIKHQDKVGIEKLTFKILEQGEFEKAHLKDLAEQLTKLLAKLDEKITKDDLKNFLQQDNGKIQDDLEETIKVEAPQIERIKEIISKISKKDLKLDEDLDVNLDEDNHESMDNKLSDSELLDEDNLHQQVFDSLSKEENVQEKGITSTSKQIEYDANVSNTNTEKLEGTKTTFKVSKPNASFKENLIQELVDKAKLTISQGKSQMELKLKPEELGKISMKIASEEDGVIGKITVENDVIKQIIETNLNTLKESLDQQGIKVQGFQVDVGSDTRKEHEKDKDEQNKDQNAKKSIGKIISNKAVKNQVLDYQAYGLQNNAMLAYENQSAGIDLTA